MANTMTKLGSQTATAQQYGFTFSSIPQTYTDLVLRISARSSYAAVFDGPAIFFNGVTSGYGRRTLGGNGTSNYASSNTSGSYLYLDNSIPAANASANVFGVMTIYIPNYANTSYYKAVNCEAVMETNGSASNITLTAGSWSSTSNITSLTVYSGSGNFVANSEFTLYGIKNS